MADTAPNRVSFTLIPTRQQQDGLIDADKSIIGTITAEINPTQLQWSLTSPHEKSGTPESDGGNKVSGGAWARSLSVNLLFDCYEEFYNGKTEGVHVKYIRHLEAMSQRQGAKTKVKGKEVTSMRSRIIIATWGNRSFSIEPENFEVQGGSGQQEFYPSNFYGVITSLNVTYSLFAEDGTPLRATAAISMSEVHPRTLGLTRNAAINQPTKKEN